MLVSVRKFKTVVAVNAWMFSERVMSLMVRSVTMETMKMETLKLDQT